MYMCACMETIFTVISLNASSEKVVHKVAPACNNQCIGSGT